MAGICFCLLDGVGALQDATASADDTGDYTTLIMGHAFLSQPDALYMKALIDTYIDNPTDFGQPQYTVVGDPVSVYTPETDYNYGLAQGVLDLDKQLSPLLEADPKAHIVIGAYSMSNSVATQEMIDLAKRGIEYPNLKFVLAEGLQNPNGGFFTRFPDTFGASLPVTPADTPYETAIYNIEYSGASDYPEYTNNFWAISNAANGYIDLHPYLLPGWPAYFDPSVVTQAVLNDNVADPTSNTSYYLIPTQDLPLLDGLHGVGGMSSIADMMQPDMRVLVDLGYDWTADPSVAAPAEAFNPDINFEAVNLYLDAGADQGMLVSLIDLGILPESDLAGIADLYPYIPDVAALQDGALNDPVIAADAALRSHEALTTALEASTNPFVTTFGEYIPGMAANMADFYQMLASSLG